MGSANWGSTMNIEQTIKIRQVENKRLGTIYRDLKSLLVAIRKKDYAAASLKAIKISKIISALAREKGGGKNV